MPHLNSVVWSLGEKIPFINYVNSEYMYDIDLISFGPGQGDINCTSLPARLGGNEKLERKFERL